MIWTFAMFWYLPFNTYVSFLEKEISVLTTCCSFDGTYLYQYTFILLYNVLFTSLPVIALGG